MDEVMEIEYNTDSFDVERKLNEMLGLDSEEDIEENNVTDKIRRILE